MEIITEDNWNDFYNKICECFWSSGSSKLELRNLFEEEGIFQVQAIEPFREGQIYYTKEPDGADIKWLILGVKDKKADIYGTKLINGQTYGTKLTANIQTDGPAEVLTFSMDDRIVRLSATSTSGVYPMDRFQIIAKAAGNAYSSCVLGSTRSIREATKYCENRGWKYKDSSGMVWNLDIYDRRSQESNRKVQSAVMAL